MARVRTSKLKINSCGRVKKVKPSKPELIHVCDSCGSPLLNYIGYQQSCERTEGCGLYAPSPDGRDGIKTKKLADGTWGFYCCEKCRDENEI